MENPGGKLVTHLYRETSLHHLTARTVSAIHYSAFSFACVSSPYFAAVSFIPLPFTYWVSPLNPAGNREEYHEGPSVLRPDSVRGTVLG